MGMRVEVFTFCWNEMSILPFAVDYWRKYASHVTVYDNGSTDGSIQYLQAQGDWITVGHMETGGEINDTILLNMKNDSWKQARGRADMIVVCDMDEMLLAPDIMHSLNTMRRVGGTICRPLWYDLVSDEPPVWSGQPLHQIRPLAAKTFPKAILFDPNAIEEINYTPGAHDCKPTGNVRWFAGDIYTLHANHNLSFEHKVSRYRLMAARLSEMNIRLQHGVHYAFSEDVLREGWESDRRRAINFGVIIG